MYNIYTYIHTNYNIWYSLFSSHRPIHIVLQYHKTKGNMSSRQLKRMLQTKIEIDDENIEEEN